MPCGMLVGARPGVTHWRQRMRRRAYEAERDDLHTGLQELSRTKNLPGWQCTWYAGVPHSLPCTPCGRVTTRIRKSRQSTHGLC
ncbi:hypothetical protein T440DRAFT_469262 [Plenodomus tracheiphilus IPT5]|uniref:Uncharacterized protein n=1 Tax=Plenodomus tracheiphilus IPT5 TaxID=1408161 RepID=A0A6A7B1V7_9PLEO|nr:hypothetical protein T440DRAFT_469262 [Plenodomus tracheiphilus IPT5]